MSTYTRPDKFVPVNISSDPSAYLNYVQKRMDLSAQGEATVRMQYKQYLDLDLTHEANKDKLNTFLTEASEKVNKFSKQNSDFSDYNNVKTALKVFEPLAKDPQYQSVLYDNKFTKHYKKQIQISENFKNKTDKNGNIGTGYNDYNYTELMQNYSKFAKNLDANNYDSWGKLYSYQPYHDYTESLRERTQEFLKMPDESERDEMNGEGIVTRVKYKGKSVEQLQAYLDATASAQDRSQMLLEGRVQARDIDDDEYVASLKENTERNLKSVLKEREDIEAFKKKPGTNVNLTPAQIKEELNRIEGKEIEYNTKLSDLNNIDKLAEIKNAKVDNYSNIYANQKIANLAKATANRREDVILDSNSARVSTLNRNQGFEELKMTLRQKEDHFNRQIDYNYAKNGMNPDGSLKVPLNDNFTIVNETVTKDEDVTQKVTEYETALNNNVASHLPQAVNSAYELLGMSTKNPFNDTKALKTVISLGQQFNSENPETGYLHQLLRTPDNQITSKEDLVKKRIAEQLVSEDANVTEYMSYYKAKQIKTDKVKQDIMAEIKAKGITLKDINSALSLHNDITGLNYRAGQFSASGALVKGVQNLFGLNSKTQYSQVNSYEEFADRVAKDPEFAKAVSGSTLSGLKDDAISIGLAGANLLTKTLPGAKILNDLLPSSKKTSQDFSIYSKNLNEELISNVIVPKVKILTRPETTETKEDKALDSRFNSEINNLYAQYPEMFKDAELNDMTQVKSVEKHQGKYIINYNDYSTDKGKSLKTGEMKVLEIPDAKITVFDKADAALLRALMYSPQGEIDRKYNHPTLGFIDYKIKTASGTPYTVSGSDNNMNEGGLYVSLKVGNEYVTIPQEFKTPTDAEKLIKDFYNKASNILTTETTTREVQKLLKQYSNLPKAERHKKVEQEFETLRKTGKLQTEVQDNHSKMYTDGRIYPALGVQDPNMTQLESVAIDVLKQILNNDNAK
jgi:hypothetical protein